MTTRLLFILLFFSIQISAHLHAKKQQYPLVDDPIDVVIVTHPKDKDTLNFCIDGIKENCTQLRRIIVVSPEKLTDKAEWFHENQFPFSKDDIATAIVRGEEKKKRTFFWHNHRSPGWYYQQLLKLYSPFIIPNLSSNVLILDSDTIFLNHVEFLNEANGALFCYSRKKAKPAYFEHAKRLFPDYKRIYPDVYSVCHHILLQKPILQDMFRQVEAYHGTEFWVAFCSCVDLRANKGASEFEIYYNFALRHTDQVELRTLRWTDSSYFSKKDDYQRKGYHFVAFHTYLRKKPIFPGRKNKKHFTLDKISESI